MSKKAFQIEGDFQMGRVRQHFSVQMVADNDDGAREALYAELGSRHGVKRREVTIESVKAIKADAADPITQKRLE